MIGYTLFLTFALVAVVCYRVATQGIAAPTRRWRGLTWVGWLNFLVLRWFFVRLAYEVPIGRFLSSAPKGGTALIEIDLVGAGFRAGDGPLRVSSSGALPPRLDAATDYWVTAPPTRWFLNRWIWPRPWAAYRYVGRPAGGAVPAKHARYEGLRDAAREAARRMTPPAA